jgi:excisionase family DNA binding protein
MGAEAENTYDCAVTAEKDAEPRPVEDAAVAAKSNTVGRVRAVETRWYEIAQAARLLGISEVALRRQIADGSLTALRAGRSWRVLLTGEPGGSDASGSAARKPTQASPEVLALVQVSESLGAVVRDLQRQNLALAGQIGYLQSQLHTSQEQVRQLEERAGGQKQLVEGSSTTAPQEHEAMAEDVDDPGRQPESGPDDATPHAGVELAPTTPVVSEAGSVAVAASSNQEGPPPTRLSWLGRLFRRGK